MARASSIDVVVKGEYQDKDIKRAMSDLQKLQAASVGMGQRMQNVGSQMQSMGRSVGKVGKSMTLGVTLPIVGVGVAATKMAMDFDESMTKIVSLVGLSRDVVQGMRGDVLRLAGETARAPQELAEALFVVTSAGLRGADAISALEMSAKAGAAGLGETKDIARSVAGALNAYGIETLSAARATDIIVATARAGNFETSQFAGALGRVLPFAKQAGASLEEVGGAVALLTRTNGDAAQSVTQVAALFRAFVVPTEEAKKALNEVGLSASDVRERISKDGLASALVFLDGKLGGNREALGKLLGSSEASGAAFQILDADAATLADTFGVVTDSVGMTGDAFGVTSETASFKMQAAFTGIKTSLIELGEVVAPFVAQFADRIKTLTDAFSGLSPRTKELIVQGLAIAAAIGPVLMIIGKLILVVGTVIKVIGLLVAVFNPVTLVIAAVVAGVALLIAGFMLVWNRTETLRKAVGDLLATMQNIARVIIGDLLGAFNRIIGRGTDLRGIFERVAAVVGRVLTVAIQRLQGVLEFLGNVVRAGIKIFEVQVKLFRIIAGVIIGVVVAAIDIFMNRLGPISFAVRRFVGGARAGFAALGGIVVGVFNNAGGAIELFVNKAISAINVLITAYNFLARVLDNLPRLTHIAEFRFQSLSAATNDTATATTNALSATGANIREMERAAAPTAELADGMGDLAAGMGDVGNAGGGAAKGTKDAGDEAEKAATKLQKFKDKFTETADVLKAKTKEIQDAYDGVIKSVQDVVTGAFDFSNIDPNRIGEDGEKVGGSFLDGLASAAEKAVAFANRVAEVVALGLQPGSAAFETVMAVTKAQGTGLLDELIKGGVEAVDRTIAIVDSVQNAGTRVGTEAADTFHGQGLKLAKETEDAFAKRFGEGGPGYNKLNRLMNHLAASLNRTSTITVNTVHTSTGSPGGGRIIAGALGGIVNRPTFALIGEAGPEAVIPLGRSRGNEPLPMTGRGGSSRASTSVINLTVHAGMGTQGAEVGRQIVDALKAYERRNGSVYVSA